MAITGTFERSIDDKLRLAIPRRLREALDIADGGELYLAPGNEGCVALFSPDGFEEFAERVANASAERPEVRKFLRLFYSRAERVVLDKQSRIRIPERLLSIQGDSRDLVILGVRDHAEVWTRESWDSYMNTNLPQFDELTETLNLPTDAGFSRNPPG